MAPRKQSTEEQLEELRQSTEALRLEFHEALQITVDNVMTTVLQRQHELHKGQDNTCNMV